MDNSITIINSYNNPTIADLIKIIEQNTDCHFILISWKLDYGYWYIRAIYDKLYDSANDSINTHINTHINNTSGWYIKEEPNINNIPIRHSKLIYNNIIATKDTKIIFSSFTQIKELTQINQFLINAYIEKLYLQDKIQRTKKYQELFLDRLSEYIKEPMKEILFYINKNRELQINDQQKEYCKQFNKTILHLTNNIFDMIDMNKLELKKLKPKKSIFSFNSLLKSAIDVVNSENKYKIDIIIENNVPDVIYNDHKKIKQILINLIELLSDSKYIRDTSQQSPRQQSPRQNSPRHSPTNEITIYATATIINLNNEDYERENSLVGDLYKSDLQYLINISMYSNIIFSEDIKNKLFCPVDFMQNEIINSRIAYLLSTLLGGNIRLLYSDKKGTCIELELITCDKEPNKSNTMKKIKDKKILLLCKNKILTDYLNKYNIQYTQQHTQQHKDPQQYKDFDLIISDIQIDTEYNTTPNTTTNTTTNTTPNTPAMHKKFIIIPKDANIKTIKNIFKMCLSDQ